MLLDIIASYSITGYSGTAKNITITYAGALAGRSVYSTTQTSVVDPDNADNVTIFPRPIDAIQFYFNSKAPTVISAASSGESISFSRGSLVYFEGGGDCAVTDILQQVTANTSDISNNEFESSTGIAAVNSALSTHASDTNAHIGVLQPLSNSLTQLSGVSSLSSDVLSMVAASNNAGIRSSIGAGTSSFDGTYAALSGRPSFATIATTGNYYDLSTKPAAKSFNNAPAPTIQTTAAAANGDRLSVFRDAEVSYSVSIDTSVSLSGNSSGYVVLEIAATNSTTATDWKEISRVSSGQSGTLVIGLTLNQTGGGNISGVVPAGYYRRLRKVNVAGTPTVTLTGCQEVLDEPLQVAA